MPKALAPSLRSSVPSLWSWLRAYGAGYEPKELGSEPKELAPSLWSWLRD